VRAVNLIPGDQRRGGGSGRSGSAAYFFLGALGVLVLAAAVYVLTGNQVNERKGELARATQEAGSLEQQAAVLRPYKDFATLSQTRVDTVASLARSRFDWERAMRQLARALPEDVWLTSLVGTVTPGVSFDGGGGSGQNTGAVRGALPVPAVELVGCTESHAKVSRVMSRLRTMTGVQRVSLASSEKVEATSAPAGGGSTNSSDCRNGNAKFPQFQIVVFFKAPPVPEAPGGQGSTPQPGQQPGQPGQAPVNQPAGGPQQ
jgi:Tfp pilus assembly protein PilN